MGVESWMTLAVLLLLIHLIRLDKGHFGLVLGCQQIERDALSQFKQSLSDPANLLSSWKGEDCCRWHGVHCNNLTGHVEVLDLHYKFTTMTIYGKDYEARKLEPCLLELKELRYLDLSGISFQECKIPEFIGSMKQLRHLNLYCTGFSGVIPPQLGNLTKLRFLQLGQSPYTNHSANLNLFVDDLHWVSGLLKLQYLGMFNVDFTKARASMMKAISSLPSLLELRLRNCKLGTNHLSHAFLANLTRLSTIQYLDLSFDNLEGHFPSVITNMSSLKSLDLSSNQLTGSIPLQIGDMGNLEHLNFAGNSFSHIEGGLAEEIIGKLCKLKELDLSDNQLEGDILGSRKNFSKCSQYGLELLNLEENKITSTLPYWLGELKNLRVLALHDNRLFGQIPESIGSLSFLTLIDLHNNSLNGTIPSSLGGLTSLQSLDFSQNDINGCIPSFLGGLSSLQYLVLSRNSLNGSIPPSLGGSSSLEIVDLSNNFLNGTIPSFDNRFCSLTYLDLSNNLLSKIPESFGCQTLASVDLSSNVLEGNVSNLHLVNLSGLKALDLSNNSLNLKFSSDWEPPFQLTQLLMRACRIQGHLPQWIQTQKNLQMLDLSDNQISGEMLQWFQYQELTILDLSYNHITGPITSFSSNLFTIDLSHNLLSGPIPQDNSTYNGLVRNSLCHLESLSYLYLQNNELSGAIPECWGNSEKLYVINLSFNKLSGLIPMTFGLLPQIEFLNLNSNSLEGEIPSTLSSCGSLVILDLGENKLSGEIPRFGVENHHYNLQILRLRENQLDSFIPHQLCSLVNLQILDLASNNLTGPIPHCFAPFSEIHSPALEFIQNSPPAPPVAVPQENTTEVLKGQELQYTSTLKFVVNFDLSHNQLVGSIPEELTKQSRLKGLNLAYNHLTGRIPKKIGDMGSLESLDLSNNNLSGTIPSSISDLAFLSYLNLSYNNLQGPIPTGTQLDTFQLTTYAGNAGLCGDPLPKKCARPSASVNIVPTGQESLHEDNRDKVILYVTTALGFIIGFWGVVGGLLLRRTWRLALFRWVEDTMYYLYVQVVVRIKRLMRT